MLLIQELETMRAARMAFARGREDGYRDGYADGLESRMIPLRLLIGAVLIGFCVGVLLTVTAVVMSYAG